MDPSYSVLLGDDKADACGIKNEKGGNSINSVAVIASVVSIIGVAVMATAFYLVAYPKLKLYLQLHSVEMQTIDSSVALKSEPTTKKTLKFKSNSRKRLQPVKEEDFQIERAPTMEVSTASGHFVVNL